MALGRARVVRVQNGVGNGFRGADFDFRPSDLGFLGTEICFQPSEKGFHDSGASGESSGKAFQPPGKVLLDGG